MGSVGNLHLSQEYYARRLLLALETMSQPDSLVRSWGLNQFQTALGRAHLLGFSVTISRTHAGQLEVTLKEQSCLAAGRGLEACPGT